MKPLQARSFSRDELIKAIEWLEEALEKLPVDYPDSPLLKSPFDEEEDDHN